MKLSDKYDSLLERHMTLEDTHKELLAVLRSVHDCATPREAKELDWMAARDPKGIDCAQSIFITPAVWAKIKHHLT